MPNCSKTFCGKNLVVVLALALSALTLLPCAHLFAQGATTASSRQARSSPRRPTLDDRVKVLAKNLELSDGQQVAIRKILEQRQQSVLQMRLDPSLSGSDRIARFRGLQEDTVVRIRAVLNEEQKKKYDPFAVRRLQPAPNQQSVDDWLKTMKP